MVFLGFAILGFFLSRPVNWLLSWFFVGFNRAFEGFSKGYSWSVAKLIRISLAMIVVYAGLLVFTGFSFCACRPDSSLSRTKAI